MTITPLYSSESSGARASGRSLFPGPILLATDGTQSSDPAFTAARLLAARLGVDVHVLSVLASSEMFVPSPEMLAVPVDAMRRGELMEAVQGQMQRHAGDGSGWRVEVAFGDPTTLIPRAAKERRASVIVTGLNRRGPLDRLRGGETLRHLARLSDVPILAVAAGFEQLPHSLLLALDFEDQSQRAAEVALALFPEVRTVQLAHVVTSRGIATLLRERPDRSEDEVAAGFEQVKSRLPEGIRVQSIRLWGDPASELLDFAEYSRADLIVAGSHRRSLAKRLMLGSVATGLLRGATQSVLIVPPAGEERESATADAEDQSTETVEPAHDDIGLRVGIDAYPAPNAGRSR